VKIAFLIRKLDRGGAETQLMYLAKGLIDSGHNVQIFVFYGGGSLEGKYTELGIPLNSLNKSGRWDLLFFATRWLIAVAKFRPCIVYSFLTEANLVALLVKFVRPSTDIIWGIRAASDDSSLRPHDVFVWLGFNIARMLSKVPTYIVTNSYAGAETIAKKRFSRKGLVTIVNGVDMDEFIISQSSRDWLCAEQNVLKSRPLIGIVARLDPIKNHQLFLLAAKTYLDNYDCATFVLVGDGNRSYKSLLEKMITKLDIEENVIWLGERSDMCQIYSALDVTTLCSNSEATPNVILESMACGTPCVATRVGDVARLLDGSGITIETNDHNSLAAAWAKSLERSAVTGREELAQQLRTFVNKSYSLEKMVDNTLVLIEQSAVNNSGCI
tara:strand:- start:3402 stop:4553 length:1152 start_codon:yes stop_codon:yes gene_type:complete